MNERADLKNRSNNTNDNSLQKFHSFESALLKSRKSIFQEHAREVQYSSFQEGFTPDVNNFTNTAAFNSQKSSQPADETCVNADETFKANYGSSTTAISSLEVKERLKNCVLNKRRSKEQETVPTDFTNHDQNATVELNETQLPIGDSSKNSDKKHLLIGGSLDRVLHQSSAGHDTERHLSLTTQSLVKPEQIKPIQSISPDTSMELQTEGINSITYNSLQTTCIGQPSTERMHGQRSFGSQRNIGDHLRKTMSEPSLKVRGAGGSHRYRHRPERRHGAANSATAVAVAMAASSVFGAELCQQLSSTLLKSEFLTSAQRQLSCSRDKVIPMDTSDVGMVASGKYDRSRVLAGQASGLLTQAALVELMAAASMNTKHPPEHRIKNESSGDALLSLVSKASEEPLESEMDDCVNMLTANSAQRSPDQYHASLPNLVYPPSCITNNRHDSLPTCETHQDRLNQSCSLVSKDYGENGRRKQNTTVTGARSDQRTPMRQPSSCHKLNHQILPRRHQALGMISRTRSAPLGLAGGPGFTRYLPGLNPQILNSPTEVSSAANFLAMEAATSTFTAAGEMSAKVSTQQTSGGNDAKTPMDTESHRSKVVSQLRKKILER